MSYFSERITDGLGLKDASIKLTRTWDNDFDTFFNTDYICAGPSGEIFIYPFNLRRELFPHKKGKTSTGEKNEAWKYTRFTPDQQLKLGRKSDMPGGDTPPPFIPVNVLEAFEKELQVSTLILTEGYIKAIAGALNGLYVVGLASITIYKDKESGIIFNDILNFIDVCKVRNVILLYDYDSLDIGKLENDLTRRPKQFLASAVNIRNQIRASYDVNVYWARSNKPDANGLDDIILKYPECVKELPDIKKMQGFFFEKLNITRDDKALEKHLRLNDVNEFYKLHEEKIKDSEFTFYNQKYKFEGEKCRKIFNDIGIFRVGDDFFQIVNKPDIRGKFKPQLEFRKRQTIIDDMGKDFIRSMPKYAAFCNIPCNNDKYQHIHLNCYNIYSAVTHIPKKGEWTITEKLIRHIFGDQYELGLDYLRVMWQIPTHILPILCLVSKKRGTGKTTFIDWLNEMWGENSVVVGNAELQNNFNSIYANKTLLMSDESKIDKDSVLEKIKKLSTDKTINLHYKFGQPHTVPYFGKIIMNSNHEDNFINTDDDEVRFWVRKIQPVCDWDKDFEQKLKDEIPAFIYFLNSTQINYQKQHRQWFLPSDIETDALKNIIENSHSGLYHNLKIIINQFFLDNEIIKSFYATPKDLKEKWFISDKDISLNYITRVLKNEFKFEALKVIKYNKFEDVDDYTTKNNTGQAYLFVRSEFVLIEADKSNDMPY